MWKRSIFYFVADLVAITAVVWLAFALLIPEPYNMFTWPAARLVWYLQPSAGSNPAPDVLRDTLLSAGIWFVLLLVADFIVVATMRKRVA